MHKAFIHCAACVALVGCASGSNGNGGSTNGDGGTHGDGTTNDSTGGESGFFVDGSSGESSGGGETSSDATSDGSATSDGGGGDSIATSDGDESGASETSVDAGEDFGPSLCDGGDVVITGTTFAPNGVDPIPHVLVYMTSNTQVFPAAPTNVECATCATPVGALAGATSAIDGTFSIVAPSLDAGGTYTFVLQTGLFRTVVRDITVAPCGSVALTKAQTSFAGATSGDNIIPKIAVGSDPTSSSTDVNDKLVQVLDAIGVTYDKFTPDKKGTASTGDLLGLLNDPTTLSKYEIVAIPCGALGDFTVAPNMSTAIVGNLQSWLKSGGRLYASDLAYEAIAKTDSADFTWAPGPSTHATDDPGNSGVGVATGTTIPGTVVDADLLAWLQAIKVVTAPATTIPIAELRDPWGALDSITTATDAMGLPYGTTYVTGDVSWHEGATTTVGPAVHPLTAQVDIPDATGDRCGRVVFTSYHVQSSTTGTGLTPQEHVLEYLFFQLSRCVRQ